VRTAKAIASIIIIDTKLCPGCGSWIPSPHKRKELECHIRKEHKAVWRKQRAAERELEGR
jgi:hypothetical protein